jgi:hypothetical protein
MANAVEDGNATAHVPRLDTFKALLPVPKNAQKSPLWEAKENIIEYAKADSNGHVSKVLRDWEQ